MTLEEYYEKTFNRYVDYLTERISREEAEDRVQNVFMSLFTRKDFCEDLIQKGEFEKYVQGAINRQPAQALREQYQQGPAISIDADNIDFLSSMRSNRVGIKLCCGDVELNDFYDEAVKLLGNPRKLISNCGFETVGELRQYIFVQYCRNSRTFEEIGGLVGCSLQNIFIHYGKIVTILTPLIERFIGRRLNNRKNDLNIPGD